MVVAHTAHDGSVAVASHFKRAPKIERQGDLPAGRRRHHSLA